jgi:NAD(P)-dependent dehydrogenase (short-subunit alcohol dehydrogenase family)
VNLDMRSKAATATGCAVVTGGTRGIGRAVASRLLSDGYQCLFTGTAAAPPPELPSGSRYYSVDFRDRDAVARFATELAELKPAVLVNNVGINLKGDTVGYQHQQYDILLDVNLRAPFVLIQAVLPGMIDAGWGRIVNITSLWGISANARDAAYTASKFGLDGLAASVAAEVARSGVLINSVAPGFIYTEAAADAYTQSELEAVSAEIPVGRLGRPEEVAALVSWLVSHDNTYLTGQNILIDGGLTRTAKP